MELNANSFRFNVGHFDCLVIRDTVSPMNLEEFFPKVPSTQLKQLLNQYSIPPGDTFEVKCLLIITGDHTVLIDTGWGIDAQPGGGKLVQNLQDEGIKCTEIDTVILTHGHPDHIGGNTDVQGRPVFPNARYMMYRKEWEFWTSGPDLPQLEERMKQTMLTSVRKNLMPIQDYIVLIDSETEIVSGINFIRAPGHTPELIVPVISSGNEQLICPNDLFHHPLLITRPDWYTPFDIMPEQASSTRAKIIRRIAGKNMLVFACHFPFPGLGHIVPKGDIYLWQPI